MAADDASPSVSYLERQKWRRDVPRAPSQNLPAFSPYYTPTIETRPGLLPPNVAPYPILNPAPTFGECVDAFTKCDYEHIAAVSGGSMALAYILCRRHWGARNSRTSALVSLVGISIAGASFFGRVAVSHSRLVGWKANGLPPLFPDYERWKYLPFDALHGGTEL